MADYSIKKSCSVCDGTGVMRVWDGTIDEDGNAVSPEGTTCTHCESGLVEAYVISVSELDDILDKCNDVLNKLNSIWDVLPDGWKE